MGTVVTERNKDWQKKEENSVQTKGGGAFATFLTMNVRPLAAGRYRMQWYAQARLQSGSTSKPQMRVRCDGQMKGFQTFRPEDSWQETSGWDFQQFSEGDTPSIEIQFKRDGGSDTVEMRKLKLSIELMEDLS